MMMHACPWTLPSSRGHREIDVYVRLCARLLVCVLVCMRVCVGSLPALLDLTINTLVIRHKVPINKLFLGKP